MNIEFTDSSVENILLVSASIIYRKIIKNALSELLPNAVFISENAAFSALNRLNEFKADLIIIDTAIINEEEFFSISSAYPDITQVLLCDQRKFEYYCDADFRGRMPEVCFNVIMKPINEGYDSNFKIIKRGLKFVLLKLFEGKQGELNKMPSYSVKSEADDDEYSILLIAASTGGPAAIEKIFFTLPKKLNLPVLIVQHMSAIFTKNLAENLSRQFSANISEASNGDNLENGKILIAPGGCHMLVDEEKRIVLDYGEAVNGVKPSADVLFSSVAKQFREEKVLVVILTGMGSDGTEGIRELKKSCRCFCIAQDEKSSIVYGMPRAIVEAGLHDRLVGLDSISGFISELLRINSSEKENI